MDNLKVESSNDKVENKIIEPINIPPMTYFILSKKGLSSYNLYGEQKKIEPNNNLNFNNVSHLGMSEDGELLVLTFDVSHSMKLIDTKTEKVSHNIVVDNNIRKILISPMKNYIMTFAHWKSEQKEGNMILWSAKTGKILKRYEQKSLDKWPLQFSPDDEYLLKMEADKIKGYKISTNLEEAEVVINAKGATDFSINSTTPYNIAIFIPAAGNKPNFIKIYKWLLFKEEVASISFFRGQEAEFHWNSKGNALLVCVTSTLDSSNNNYYGNKDLYYLRTSGFTCTLESGKIIHDVSWHKYGKRFAVISGPPPTTTTIFNWKKAEEKENFGRAYVNVAKFSNNGYLLALMGFGTFKGNITLWDQKQAKEVCSVDAFTSSTFDWSPDSRYFLTATLARMQDNSYKMWAYDGTLLHEEKLDSITQAFFKPLPLEAFPVRLPSPRLYEKAQQQKKNSQKEETQKYCPPQRRGIGGSNISQKLNELRNQSEVPQYVPTPSQGTSKFDKLGGNNNSKPLPFGYFPETEPKKGKKKKKNKKTPANSSSTETNNNNNTNNNTNNNNSNTNSNSGGQRSPRSTSPRGTSPRKITVVLHGDRVDNQNNLVNLQKNLKKVNKKLKDIEKLKLIPNPAPTQTSKINSESQLLEQKKNLEKQISLEKK
eukprot:TRINITY_DN610_c3_g1_i1.p1 TRINITY_DN610_c3_g1~~TRINITY_DN610_c3_g1_i1.p1  ORF type:complete len:669 (+),score=256.96 TRINITY_DN610_c3_g1_i1:46-2007(+)